MKKLLESDVVTLQIRVDKEFVIISIADKFNLEISTDIVMNVMRSLISMYRKRG